MSIIGQQVFAAPGQVFSTISGGGGGGGSVGNTLTLSTLTFGSGVDSNGNNILMGDSGVVAMAAVGDSNQIQIGACGQNQILGSQYAITGFFANGAGGDITFGDINGNNSALTAINYQSAGYNSGSISTFIYGTTQILPSGAPSGAGSELLVSSILCSTINGTDLLNPTISTLTFSGSANPRANIFFPSNYNAKSEQDAWLFKVARGGGAASYLELDVSGQDTQTGFPGLVVMSGAGSTTEITNEFGSTTIYCGGRINLSTPQLTLNGGPIGGGGGNIFPEIQVSSSAGQPASLYITGNDADLYNIYVSSASRFTGMSLGLQAGRQELYSAVMEAPDFYTSTIKGPTGQISMNPAGTDQIVLGGLGAPGDISVRTTGGGAFNVVAGSVSTNTNNMYLTGGLSGRLTIAASGAANPLYLQADNAAGATIWSGGVAGVTLSTVTSVNGSVPMVYAATPYGTKYGVQMGYVQDCPQASTILFPYPYDTENVGVMITPTNRNISGGQNPAISLLTSYGVSGTGVSSIGFATDARDGGVGYTASFMWMAMPRNLA